MRPTKIVERFSPPAEEIPNLYVESGEEGKSIQEVFDSIEGGFAGDDELEWIRKEPRKAREQLTGSYTFIFPNASDGGYYFSVRWENRTFKLEKKIHIASGWERNYRVVLVG